MRNLPFRVAATLILLIVGLTGPVGRGEDKEAATRSMFDLPLPRINPREFGYQPDPLPRATKNRTPAPTGQFLASAEKRIDERYGPRLTPSSPKLQRAMAEELLNEGYSSERPTESYVMLLRSRELFINSGEIAGALEAANELTTRYVVDARPLQKEAIERCAANVRTAEQCDVFAAGALRAIDSTVRQQDFYLASLIADTTENAAKSTNNEKVAKVITARKIELKALADQAQRLRALVEALESKPNDAAANLALGKLQCFERWQWKKGLPNLAKGDDAVLSPLAQREIAAGDKVDALKIVADDWWATADQVEAQHTRVARAHAASIYESIEKHLNEEERRVAEQRIQTIVAGPDGAVPPRRIIYVCDGSGSMMQKFDLLKIQITQAVNGLDPQTSFNVIFFQGGEAVAVSKEALLPANTENKQKVYTFLREATLAANSDPTAALRLAFKQQPDIVYLLTDGEFPKDGQILSELAKLNADREVVIVTIAFANPNERDAAYVQVLQKIADDHGGEMRFVTASDLVK